MKSGWKGSCCSRNKRRPTHTPRASQLATCANTSEHAPREPSCRDSGQTKTGCGVFKVRLLAEAYLEPAKTMSDQSGCRGRVLRKSAMIQFSASSTLHIHPNAGETFRVNVQPAP